MISFEKHKLFTFHFISSLRDPDQRPFLGCSEAAFLFEREDRPFSSTDKLAQLCTPSRHRLIIQLGLQRNR